MLVFLRVFCYLSFTPNADYRFLEDTGRFADGAARDNLIRTPRASLKVRPYFTNDLCLMLDTEL